jgi:phosphopantothenoylcysteine decarboxylase/phosphopantothenate--cysteine ligase
MLRGKKIILGVTASIAAYKASFLTRLLIKAGAEVKVVLTPAARDFVTPLTLSTLSKNPVHIHFTHEEDGGLWTNHVDLGLWADLMIIAPATSNTLAKMVSGTCDNLLMGVYLSAKCPVFVAPAMDLDMYAHPSTQSNLKALESYGNLVIPSGTGELASGLSGEGRMAEPEEIVEYLEKYLEEKAPLKGQNVLINAGPTHEPIDAVRFIGNHSTGKMGHALAAEAVSLGANVTLVLGPTSVPFDFTGMEVVKVQTAAEMHNAMTERFDNAHITICSAAVADFRPANAADHKIKKDGGVPKIELEPTEDILHALGQAKKGDQRLIGFALETQNEKEYAMGKLEKKNLDAVVMNTLNDEGAGFGHDTNKVYVYSSDGQWKDLEMASKPKVARLLWKHFTTLFTL